MAQYQASCDSCDPGSVALPFPEDDVIFSLARTALGMPPAPAAAAVAAPVPAAAAAALGPAAATTAESAGAARGLCVLYSCASSFPGLRLARVDPAGAGVGAWRVVAMAPSVDPGLLANAGVVASLGSRVYVADDGAGFSMLLEIDASSNSTRLINVSSPAGQSAQASFFALAAAAGGDGDHIVALELAIPLNYPPFVLVADVFVANASSEARSANFALDWVDSFDWHKTGVAALDTRRGIFYPVVGRLPTRHEVLAGVPMTGSSDRRRPLAAVLYGPTDAKSGAPADVTSLLYSAARDELLAVTLGTAGGPAAPPAVYARPAGPSGGPANASWTMRFAWPAGLSGELGNAALADDGDTVFAWWASAGAGARPSFFAVSASSGAQLGALDLPADECENAADAHVADVTVC
jgi:hypothetical protein